MCTPSRCDGPGDEDASARKKILCRRGAVDADVIIAPGLDVVHDFHIVH